MPAFKETDVAQALAWLDDEFKKLNGAHFSGNLPNVAFGVGAPRPFALASYAPVSRVSPGGTSLIFFPPSTISRGRVFVSDSMLHEMVHHALSVGGGDFMTHGAEFAAEATRIGKKLGLPSVRPNDPEDPEEFRTTFWPTILRPVGYYGSQDSVEWRFEQAAKK